MAAKNLQFEIRASGGAAVKVFSQRTRAAAAQCCRELKRDGMWIEPRAENPATSRWSAVETIEVRVYDNAAGAEDVVELRALQGLVKGVVKGVVQ
jgi:hypothetical protein